jgi:hypothetical protein
MWTPRKTVASEENLRVAGAQEPECTDEYMRIPSTAGAQIIEHSRFFEVSMRRLVIMLLGALVLVASVEILFRLGLWEPLARPSSHAGTSVRIKRTLGSTAIPRLDFVTLGSSRPEYGLDHVMIAAAAREHGWIHADLSMPGSHWMTVGILTRWLERERPEVRGGIIALSAQDFSYPGNGTYELGIVYPFYRLADIPWMAEHVPFQREDIDSYGVYSALFEWRQDIRDFITSPRVRVKSLIRHARNDSPDALFANPSAQGDMCRYGLDSIAACDRLEASTDTADEGLKRQCRDIRAGLSGGLDYATLMQQAPLPESLEHTRDLVQTQLAQTRWAQPPLVILMPMPPIWFDRHGDGLRDWALSILQPLADSGRIRLIDATHFFDGETNAGCADFFDFFHQNAAGRERLTRWLLPQIETALYGAGKP